MRDQNKAKKKRASASARARGHEDTPILPPPPERRGRAAKSRFQPVPPERMPRFAGVPTFLRLPITAEEGPVPKVDVLLCGVPLDAGTNFRAGARFGPRAVRDASALSRRFSAALGVDIYEELEVADGGDVAVTPHDIGQALSSVAARAESIVRSGAVGGFIGGDQTVTLGVLRGIHRAKLRSVGLLHIDAHSNTCRSSWGQDVHHESVIRNAVEEGLVRPDRVLQMGIRGPYSSAEDMDFALSSGFEIVKIDDLRWDLHGAISQLRRFVGQGSIYVSVDVCALDPAFAPGVGTPSPGGMSIWELQQILRALVGAEIVGFDLVEIAPPYDRTGVTALAGVSTLQEILAALADTRRSARSAPSSRAPGSVRRGRRRSA